MQNDTKAPRSCFIGFIIIMLSYFFFFHGIANVTTINLQMIRQNEQNYSKYKNSIEVTEA